MHASERSSFSLDVGVRLERGCHMVKNHERPETEFEGKGKRLEELYDTPVSEGVGVCRVLVHKGGC